jgi:hypothetical protein
MAAVALFHHLTETRVQRPAPHNIEELILDTSKHPNTPNINNMYIATALNNFAANVVEPPPFASSSNDIWQLSLLRRYFIPSKECLDYPILVAWGLLAGESLITLLTHRSSDDTIPEIYTILKLEADEIPFGHELGAFAEVSTVHSTSVFGAYIIWSTRLDLDPPEVR